MKKDKKLKRGILIIGVVFTLLYFTILIDDINLSIHNITIGKKNITPNLSTGNSGSFEWNRTWGGVNYEGGYGVVVDSLDNVYVVGDTDFGEGGKDMVLVKYYGNGIQQWNRTWGGYYNDIGNGVAVDSLDNVFVVGYTYSFGKGNCDIVLVKYYGNGTQQWNRTWGGADLDRGRGLTVDSSDNLYIAGDTASFGEGTTDLVLVKYDQNGIQQWNRTWGGIAGDYGYGVAVDSSDNVYVAGRTESFGEGGEDVVLVKYDGNGTQQWSRIWGGGDDEYGSGVAVDSLDNVFVAGYTESFGKGNRDMVLIKYYGNGTQQWYLTWGEIYYDDGYGVTVDSLDNVYLVGATESFGAGMIDMILVKYNGNGTQQWYRTWGGNDGDLGYDVAVDSLDNVYVAGYTESFGAGGGDLVLIKYSNVKHAFLEEFIIVLIIVLSIASIVGVGLVIMYIRNRRKILDIKK